MIPPWMPIPGDPTRLQGGLTADQSRSGIVLGLLLLLVVIELVRRRKLREEYSMLWVVTACGIVLLAWRHDILDLVRRATGIVEPQSALFFGAFLFLISICLQFSVRLSKLTWRNRMLAQRVALLEQELREQPRREAPAREGQSREEPAATTPSER